MNLKNLLTEIQTNLSQTDDISVLSDWDAQLSTEYAWLCQMLGEVKKDRAKDEISIREKLLKENGKYTEKEIERQYFATERGMYLAEQEIVIKGVSRLIGAIRSKKEMMR